VGSTEDAAGEDFDYVVESNEEEKKNEED